ncbi:MAG TPA: type II toxin-antitoxin system prevent-host-death family antitoxin [Pyrinomonadaceae bacterium]
MSDTRITISKAREDFAETLNRVAYRGERIILHRREKDMVAIIPIEDLALLEELEGRLDIEAAHEALAESDERIPYEKVRKEITANVSDRSDARGSARSHQPTQKRVQTRRR